jgi:hypothetical protein
MSESKEPDWLAELAKGGEVVRREIRPLVQAAEQFVRDARRAKTSARPTLPFAQRVALAVDAGMRELLPPQKQPTFHQATAALTVTPVMTAVATVTASISLTMQPMRVYGQATVGNRPAGLAALSDGQILALVLVWLFAVALPRMQAALPPDLQAILSNYYATVGLALIITWRIRDKHR